MIRRATQNDLEGVYRVLKSVGNAEKIPARGFLLSDYTQDEEKYRAKYARDLKNIRHAYVYMDEKVIKGFLFAFTKEEWLADNPSWESEIFWHPSFAKESLKKYILINQTAMFPELTGRGIGSMLYETLTADLIREGIKDIFAETVIAPVPNFASLNFRQKQKYMLAGLRYEPHGDSIYTTLVYHRTV